jgi:hypothetical protein
MDRSDAGLFLLALGSGFEVLSALNSSPWTAENFGADEERAKSSMFYTYLGLGIATAIGAGASLLTQSPAPLIGVLVISALMIYIYRRAIKKGRERGNKGWVREERGWS